VQEVVDGEMYWLAPSTGTAAVRAPKAHLLPNYDEYLVAFKNHALFLDLSLRKRARTLDDVVSRHVVALNGMVIGGWRAVRAEEGVCVELNLLVPLARREKEVLHAAVERYGRFLRVAVAVAIRRR
jgi:hypothetical protein